MLIVCFISQILFYIVIEVSLTLISYVVLLEYSFVDILL